MPSVKPTNVSEIWITELAGEKRSVVLKGAALPKQGSASWGAKMRVVTTWYPGNAAQGTQQVIGPQESVSQWEGEWNTTRLIRSDAKFVTSVQSITVQFADQLRELLESIFRSGALLKVSWISNPGRIRSKDRAILASRIRGTDYGAPDPGDVSIVRLGRASEWNFNYDRVDDIKWNITWEWTSRGDLQQKVAETRQTTSQAQEQLRKLSQMGVSIQQAAVNVSAFRSNSNIPYSATVNTLGQFTQIATKIKNLTGSINRQFLQITNRVNDIVKLINTAKALPFEIMNQTLDVAQNAVIVANNFHDSITRVPAELHSTQQRVASITRSAGYSYGVSKTSIFVSDTAATQASALQTQVQSRHASGYKGRGIPSANRNVLSNNGKNSLQATHVVRQGETLMSISMLYFNTIDYVADIAFSNGIHLRTPTLTVGSILVIPTGTGLSSKMMGITTQPVKPSPGNTPIPNGVGYTTGSSSP